MSFSSSITWCVVFATVATITWAIIFPYPLTYEYLTERALLSWVFWFIGFIIVVAMCSLVAGDGHNGSYGKSNHNRFYRKPPPPPRPTLNEYESRVLGRQHGYV